MTDSYEQSLTVEEGFEQAISLIEQVKEQKRKVLLVGNGGSAAVTSHVQNDLCKCAGVRAMVLTEIPLLTALSNDESYPSAFEAVTELWKDPGDLMIAVSSSGQSENILRAAQAMIQINCPVITFTGFSSNNTLRRIGTINMYVDSNSYGVVETAHATLLHYLTDQLAVTYAYS